MQHILFIAPYADLAQEAAQLNRELGLNVPVLVANLPDALGLLEVTRRQGAEVIVSRGGVVLALREMQSEIPVVAVRVTAYDVLEAIQKGSQYGLPMAMVGFAPVVYGADRVASLLNIKDLHVEILQEEAECEAKVRRLAEAGIGVIIGDTVATQTAQRYGLKAILIRSGKEAVLNAYREAERLLEARQLERAHTEQLRAILDNVQSGVVAVNPKAEITLINPEAARILGVDAERSLGLPVKMVIPNSRLEQVLETGTAEAGAFHDIGGVRLVTNRVPITVDGMILGAVATFQEVHHVQEMERRIRKEQTDRGHVAKSHFGDIIGQSEAMARVITKAQRFAAVDSVILLRGETGTGKEIFAQSIHNHGPRRKRPFVAVNCAALPPTLLESELFGYVKGAFTDARHEGKMGLFEQAHGGTLLLDEVTEMPPNMQARLLRVLQEREIIRIGDDRVIPVDVRVIATTNRDLEEMVSQGEFRSDLYYRLNILNLVLPPLRERQGDLPLLLEHFLTRFAQRYQKMARAVSMEAMAHLQCYHWPGNIRELAGFAERLTVQESVPQIGLAECLELIPNIQSSVSQPYDLARLTMEAIKRAMVEASGNKSRAAEILGIDRTTLYRKLKEYDLSNSG